MRIVENRITDYESANFSEDEAEWLIGSAFDYSDEIRDGHYIYKYAGETGTNTDESPEIDSISLSPKWVKTRPTNYFAMLDGETKTQTENANSIVIEIESNNYDSLSLLGVEAQTVKLELFWNGTLYQTIDFELQDETEIVDEYSYWFNDFTFIPSVYTQDIWLLSDAILKITIENTGDIAKCGRLVHGRSFFVGDTGYGANLSLDSFSRKETDVFGGTNLVHIDSVDSDSFEVKIPTSKIPVLKRKAKSLDAVAILFIMDESETSNTENLLNFGYWESFSMLIKTPTSSIISIHIKGIL